jgi:hypothetical protein
MLLLYPIKKRDARCKMATTAKKSPGAQAQQKSREKRLAKALRENLRKRKKPKMKGEI